jgi:hypothetical protein
MEEQQLVEAISQALRKTDVMRSFLKDNLSVQISTQREFDYGNEYTVITVGIYLNGEEICTSTDSVR